MFDWISKVVEFFSPDERAPVKAAGRDVWIVKVKKTGTEYRGNVPPFSRVWWKKVQYQIDGRWYGASEVTIRNEVEYESETWAG